MARIAWIEDDHERIGALVELIKKEGHQIIPYVSWTEVEENKEVICQTDAIILDIILPPPNEERYHGLLLLKKFREECGYQGPVIVCSRVRNPEVRHELRELGVADILVKPVRPSTLRDAILKALQDKPTELAETG